MDVVAPLDDLGQHWGVVRVHDDLLLDVHYVSRHVQNDLLVGVSHAWRAASEVSSGDVVVRWSSIEAGHCPGGCRGGRESDLNVAEKRSSKGRGNNVTFAIVEPAETKSCFGPHWGVFAELQKCHQSHSSSCAMPCDGHASRMYPNRYYTPTVALTFCSVDAHMSHPPVLQFSRCFSKVGA